MKVYETAAIRNVAVAGHGDAGKTSLVASLLFAAGATDKLGSVPDGTTLTDFDSDEVERQVSMSLAVVAAEAHDCKLNLIDAPGYASFIGDASAAQYATDSALLVVHGVDGIGVRTERSWDIAEKSGAPVLFCINQLDKDVAEFGKVVAGIQERFGRQAIPVSIPIGSGTGTEGVVDLISGKAVRGSADSAKADVSDAPGDMADDIASAREALAEMVAESDDDLMNTYLEEGELSDEQLLGGLKKAVLARKLFPIFASVATSMIGVHTLLEGLTSMAPSPADVPPRKATKGDEEIELTPDSGGPLVGQIFKTHIDAFAGRISVIRIFSGTASGDQAVYDVDSDHGTEKMGNMSAPLANKGTKIATAHAGDIVSVTKMKSALTGHTLVGDKSDETRCTPIPFPKAVIAYVVKADEKSDEEKITAGLQKLVEEDPTISLDRDKRTHELMMSGLGMNHVKHTLNRMSNRYQQKAVLEAPKVPYLETITKSASDSYRHKKQSGGAGQFAEVHMRIEPMDRGAGFVYESEIFGGSISRNFWPSIEKGVKQIMETGAVAGYPLVDVKAVIFDGKEHPVDSKDIAFQIAGRNVFKSCVRSAKPVILEPIMKVQVSCPDDNMGDILGDLNRRRGRVQGSDSQSGRTTVNAEVPMEEMLEYDATLRSLTSGRGSYTMELDHYDKVPAEIQQKLMAEFKDEETED